MAENDFDPSLFTGLSSDPTTAAELAPDPEPASESPTEPVAPATSEPTEVASTPDVSETSPAFEPTALEDMTPRERALLERIERLTGEHLAATQAPTTPEPVVPEAAEHNFLDGLVLDDVLATPENFNAVLRAVHDRAVEQTSRLAAENILRNLPQVISQYVTQHIAMEKMVQQFYEEHPALSSMKRTVAAAANEIAAEDPGLSVSDVFSKAAERVYTMVGLQKAAAKPKVARPITPRGTTNTGGRLQVPALQGLAGEVAELFNIR